MDRSGGGLARAHCRGGANLPLYERLDGGLQESPPLVNVIRIRENGPLAVVADLRIVNGLR